MWEKEYDGLKMRKMAKRPFARLTSNKENLEILKGLTLKGNRVENKDTLYFLLRKLHKKLTIDFTRTSQQTWCIYNHVISTINP